MVRKLGPVHLLKWSAIDSPGPNLCCNAMPSDCLPKRKYVAVKRAWRQTNLEDGERDLAPMTLSLLVFLYQSGLAIKQFTEECQKTKSMSINIALHITIPMSDVYAQYTEQPS